MKPPPLPVILAAMAALCTPAGAEPAISLHPENPHYFQWRGKPTVVITSAEHYGAVLNPDFDYHKYLKTLAADGLNYTRVFTGVYVEPQGAFQIARNTLAPAPGKLLCPWARSDQPGYALGGNKFDLTQWDDTWFERLKDFVGSAAKQGVIVEVTLFCPMYEDLQWKLSPMNAANNVNHLGAIEGHAVHTLDKNGGLLAVQEAVVRKIVTALNPFDNVIFELCNEPYFGGVTMDWQQHIAEVITATERDLPHRHLIAQNIANHTATIEKPHAAVSIFNFHYATPPDAVAANFHLNKVTGDDETGFNGTGDTAYRTEAWDFILAGGGLFNHLDYSFAAGMEDGTFAYPETQPGGGGTAFRKQMKVLRDFIHSFDFIHMQPDHTVIQGGLPPGGSARALVQPGKAMAIYLRSGPAAASSLQLRLPDGPWTAEWINPKTGETTGKAAGAEGGSQQLKVPAHHHDIALRIRMP